MSQMFSYFKNLLHFDRKRRAPEGNDLPPNFLKPPKYRKVSNFNKFPKFAHPTDDETDFYQLRNLNQARYNELLLDRATMDNRKFPNAFEEEFSDDDDVNNLRYSSSQRRMNKELPPSAYNSQSSRKSTSTGYNFSKYASNNINENPFGSRRPFQKSRQDVPALLPISNSFLLKNHEFDITSRTNGDGPSQPNRRSVLDFQNVNRAFQDSPKPRLPNLVKRRNSVINRDHNLIVKSRYDELLSMLIPRFAQKGKHLFTSDSQIKAQEQTIPVVDLSSDENEQGENVAGAVSTNHFKSINRNSKREFQIQQTINLSDDEGDAFNQLRPDFTSTTLKNKSRISNSPLEQRKSQSSSSFVVPQISPINSLKDRQQSRECLKEDIINSISRKFLVRKLSSDQKIKEAEQSISKLSIETAEQEKLQQRKIDQTVSSLKQIVIIDDEDEVVDEFPQLTDKQLQTIGYVMQNANRSEVIVSKFNMSITRQDLLTLDGLNWLNDEVINFYMEMLRSRSEQNEHLPKVYAMNTFFLVKLLRESHQGVKRWTRKVDIFSYDIIPIPVHVGGVHWCMSVIHLREKTIKYYDSMGHPNDIVLKALERYLHDESMDKRKKPFDTSDFSIECVRDCPKQQNGSDCGVFSCQFAEFITRDSNVSFTQQHMQYFRRKMVYEIATGQLILGNN